MKPIQELKSKITAVFSDLDDTLTTHGQLSSAVYEQIFRIKKAGMRFVIVSGRPAGWADCLMRLWPIDAMIFENGAGYYVRTSEGFETHYLASLENVQKHRAHLSDVFEKIRAEIPSARLARDQNYRVLDFAVDICEDLPHLNATEVKKVCDLLDKEKEITYKVSSIHINYWRGTHTKVTACKHLLENFGKTWGISLEKSIFCGDSPNDEPLFHFFPESVGVANISEFKDQLTHFPKYVTKKPCGEGFQEVSSLILTPVN